MMKKNYMIKLLFFLIIIYVSGDMYSQGFKHPGLLLTNEDFERIKAQIEANNPDVIAGYNNLKYNEWSQSDVGTAPSEVVRRGTDNDNFVNAGRGAHAAYLNAIRWKLSGDVAHANRAVYILNSWASVTKEVTGNSNQSLASGLYGYEFAHAAELMRDYKGWDPADFEKFKVWMRQVWYPKCYDFLIRRHDTWKTLGAPGHYWSNWGLCNTLAIMSIGVLCDDPFMYNQGLAFYKYDKIGTFNNEITVNPTVSHVESWGFNEFLGNLVPVVYDDERGPLGKMGQMQESGRDQAHSMMALGLAVDICQVAWNQGDDLFAYMDNRLLAGIAWVAAYNTGTDDLPWTDYWYHAAADETWKQTAPSATQRGQFRPIWDRIIGHYEGQKGITLNYEHDMADKVVADAGISSSHASSMDHLGFTTLTCTRPKISADQAPVSLTATMVYENETYQKGELNNVTPGSSIKLIPVLPDSVVDTGNWMWSTGSTSKDIEITADRSALYRVVYTNENGIESVQLFSISVYGDCLPDIYSYSVTTSDGIFNDTIVSVKQHSKVVISVNSSSWHSTYSWDTGETSGTKEVTIENRDTLCSVTGTNLGGAEETINFHINVEPLSASYKVGNGDVEYNNTIAITAGRTVTLMPDVKLSLEGGTWLWDNGETSQNLVLENIQEGRKLTTTYSYNGAEYSQTFSIIILPDENSFAYWPMDEDNGSIVHDVWTGKDAEKNSCFWTNMGANNGGIFFDGGASSFVQLPNDFPGALNDFAISAWVKPDALDTWARIWDFGTNTSYNMFLTGKSGDGYARFAIKSGGSEQQITTTSTLEINKWTHIAVTKSGNLAKLYINGTAAGSNAAMTLNPSDLGYTSQNYVGKSQWPDPLFRGTIDELRIYSSSLSQSDIVEIMESVTPFYPGYSLDGGEVIYNNTVPAIEGQSIELMPVIKPGMKMIDGSWLWSTGNKTQNLLLENVQASTEVSVSYNYNGRTYQQTYVIKLAEDVTSTYMKNPGFDINCNYKQEAGSGFDLGPGFGAVQAIEGWNRVQNGEWAAGSSYEYGYLGKFNGITIPSSGSVGEVGNGAGALGISAGWTASVVYYQTVSLPAGTYSFEYKAYNANADATQGTSLTGWIPNGGSPVLSSKTTFDAGAWETEVLNFTLEEETAGKIQVGLQSANAGTGDHAKIFVDYVNLKSFSSGNPTGIPVKNLNQSGISIRPSISSTGNFTLNSKGDTAIITVYNLAGQVVKQISTKASEISFSVPESQMYIVKVSTDKTSDVFKIINR